MYQAIKPEPVADPKLILWNEKLAQQFAIPEQVSSNANLFTGNELHADSEPIALAYCGHQFGHFNPELGDGRAHLLGELIDKDGLRFDIQLKGSGTTRYSRQGDGRCALGPAVREFLMSEALYALGVPTSRCLAVATTGEQVYREKPLAGAVVTRIASSHIRVGTFQYVAMTAYQQNDQSMMADFCGYVIDRHFPECRESEQPVVAMFEQIIDKQITLVTEWLRIGFIHGVMNTDNTAISGETIDFGPCAMLGQYHPGAVFSSIDRRGRYAFGNQRNITLWNMTRLAESLLPLLELGLGSEEKALSILKQCLEQYHEKFDRAYYQMMGRKLGFEFMVGSAIEQEDKALIESLTELMTEHQLDYTITFNELGTLLSESSGEHNLPAAMESWLNQWQQRVSRHGDIAKSLSIMTASNPLVIPRNHHVEQALSACYQGDFSLLDTLLEVIRKPYQLLENTAHFQDAPTDGDANYQTFCGT